MKQLKRELKCFGRVAIMSGLLLFSGTNISLADGAEEQRATPLVSELRAYVVEIDETGEEQFSPAELAEPGTVVEYRLGYENVSASPLTGVKAIGPIPESTNYVEDSATTSLIMTPRFSIDRGRSFHTEPVVSQIELADGTTGEREAKPEMYTHVSWRIAELEPETNTELRYRVRVR